MGIFEFIGDSVTEATDALVTPTVTAMIEAVNGVALVCVTVYILLIGFCTVLGIDQTPAKTLARVMFKVALITGFSFKFVDYEQYIIESFAGLEQDIASMVTVGEADAGTIYQSLDAVVNNGASLALLCLQNADDAGWNFGSIFGWWITALVVSFGTALVGIMGGAAIILAKFALAILISLGPLFFFALIFPITARFFTAWFAQTMNYTLLVVIVSIIMAFAIAAFNRMIEGADLSGAGEQNPWIVSVQIFVLTFVMVFVIREGRSMAAGLAGGLSMSALSIAQAISPATTITNKVNAPSTRRDLQSGMMTTAGRTNHIVAGNTPVNPAYLQNITRNIGRNWSMPRGGKASGG